MATRYFAMCAYGHEGTPDVVVVPVAGDELETWRVRRKAFQDLKATDAGPDLLELVYAEGDLECFQSFQDTLVDPESELAEALVSLFDDNRFVELTAKPPEAEEDEDGDETFESDYRGGGEFFRARVSADGVSWSFSWGDTDCGTVDVPWHVFLGELEPTA
jgi:hypothetical protein